MFADGWIISIDRIILEDFHAQHVYTYTHCQKIRSTYFETISIAGFVIKDLMLISRKSISWLILDNLLRVIANDNISIKPALLNR